MKKNNTLAFIALLVLLLQSCTIAYRGIRYGHADIDDYHIFPHTDVNTGNAPFHFTQGDTTYLSKTHIRLLDNTTRTLDEHLKKTSTNAFIVIRNDSILFEKYYGGRSRDEISTLFSVSKSISSLLTGLAVDDGAIDSVNDLVVQYLPELKKADPNFQKLTIAHLLDMRSGLKFTESYTNPFKGMAALYYGTNQMAKIKRMKFEHEPGAVHNYQSASTAILGMVVEKATGKPLGKYLEEKIWIPLGMEYPATWSVDDQRHRVSKSYCGVNATAIDLAKIGRLYLNNGRWEQHQILSKEWIAQSTTPQAENNGYQYQWRSKGINMRTKGKVYYSKAFYALGIMQQVLYVDPDKNLIIVRLGTDGDTDEGYPNFIYRLATYL